MNLNLKVVWLGGKLEECMAVLNCDKKDNPTWVLTKEDLTGTVTRI
jgi:hypothetical protein